MRANTNVLMVRENLGDLPDPRVPDTVLARYYRPGDRRLWVELHVVADLYNTISSEVFDKQFHRDEAALSERMIFFFNRDLSGAKRAECIATATAWYDDENQRPEWGRVHWVAVHPDYQGRGLGKAAVTSTMRRLKELGYSKAFLDTSTGRVPAVNLYLRVGFAPLLRSETEREAWREIIPMLQPDLAPIVEKVLLE